MADTPSGSSDTSGNPLEDDLTSEEDISSTPSTPSSEKNARDAEPNSSSSVGENARDDEPNSLTSSEDETSSASTKDEISSTSSSVGENARHDASDSSEDDGTLSTPTSSPMSTPASTPTSPAPPRALTPPITPPPEGVAVAAAAAAPACDSCRRALKFSPPDQTTPESEEDDEVPEEAGRHLRPESGEDEAAIYDELAELCDVRLLMDLHEHVPENRDVAAPQPAQQHFEPPDNPQLRGVYDHLSDYLDCFAQARTLLGLGLDDLEDSAQWVRGHRGTKTAKRLHQEMRDREREIDAMLEMYREVHENIQLLAEKRRRMEAVVEVLAKRTEAFRKKADEVLGTIGFVDEEVRRYLGSVGDSEANVCVLFEKLEELRGGEVRLQSLKEFKWSMEIAMYGLVAVRRQKRELVRILRLLVREKDKFRKVVNAYLREKRIARMKMEGLGKEIEALVEKVGLAMDTLSAKVIFVRKS